MGIHKIITQWRQWERAGIKGSKSTMWTNRKAVSLASSSSRRLHVSRFHHNIQVGSLPLIGQTSVLIPSHCSGLKNRTTVEQASRPHSGLEQHRCNIAFSVFSNEGKHKIKRRFHSSKTVVLFFSLCETAESPLYVGKQSRGLHPGGQQRGNIV